MAHRFGNRIGRVVGNAKPPGQVPWTFSSMPDLRLVRTGAEDLHALDHEVETGPAEQMTRAIMTELESQSRLEAVAGETPAGALTKPDTGRRPARSDSDYRAALTALKEGAKQAQKLRFPQAIRALRRGIDGLADNLEFLDDYTRMIDAYVLLAVAYFWIHAWGCGSLIGI